jgi:hypothetical protein
VRYRVRALGINKAGEQHPSEKGKLKTLKSCACRKIGIGRHVGYDKTIVDGRLDNGIQDAAEFLQTIVQRRSRAGDHAARIGVSETCVVPGNSKCEQLADMRTVTIERRASARCRVIDLLGGSTESALECVGIFAEIVQQTCNVTQRVSVEFRGATSGPGCDGLQMEL